MTGPLNCIIADDEEGSHKVLEHYLRAMPSLRLTGSFYNGIEAINYIYSHPVDLMFLDINMPGLSGMEVLGTMRNPPLVVLTTAYTEYALEGYKYQVVDYLVKPIEFPVFVSAVDKVFSRLRPVGGRDQSEVLSSAANFLMLKVEGDMIRVMLDSILYIQSMGNYIKVFTQKEIYISPMSTIEIEQKLDKSRFRRIHKSYIVALRRLQRIAGTQIYLDNGVSLPVGLTFRRELMEYFQ